MFLQFEAIRPNTLKKKKTDKENVKPKRKKKKKASPLTRVKLRNWGKKRLPRGKI